MELLLLRDLRRFGAAFLLLRLFDFLRRFADFLLGADFLRDARRLFGAMVSYKSVSSSRGDTFHTKPKHITTFADYIEVARPITPAVQLQRGPPQQQTKTHLFAYARMTPGITCL